MIQICRSWLQLSCTWRRLSLIWAPVELVRTWRGFDHPSFVLLGWWHETHLYVSPLIIRNKATEFKGGVIFMSLNFSLWHLEQQHGVGGILVHKYPDLSSQSLTFFKTSVGFFYLFFLQVFFSLFLFSLNVYRFVCGVTVNRNRVSVLLPLLVFLC